MRKRSAGQIAVVGITLVICWAPVLSLLLSRSASLAAPPASGIPARLYLAMAQSSLAVSGGAMLLALALGMPVAFLLLRVRPPLRGVWAGGLVVAATIPLYVYAAAWLTQRTLSGSFPGSPFPQTGFPDVLQAALISGLAKTPLAALLCGICLWGIDPDEEEAAWLNTGRRGVFLRVALRHLLWGGAFAAAVLFGLCLGEITVTDMLAVRTLAEETYMQFQLTLDAGSASRVGMLAVLPVLVAWLIAVLAHNELHFAPSDAGAGKESTVYQVLPHRWRVVALLITCVVLGGVLGVPMWRLTRLAFDGPGFIPNVSACGRELAYSLGLALVASFCATSIAFPLLHLARSLRCSALVIAIACASLFVPGTLLGIALIRWCNRDGLLGWFYDTPGILILGQMLRSVPLSLLILWICVRKTPLQYGHMAAVDGLTPWQTLWHVYFPISAWPLLTAWAISMVWCLGELDTSLIVCPPGIPTLPVRTFTMMHYGIYGQVAASCLAMICAVLLVGTAVLWVARRAGIVWHRSPHAPVP